MDTKGTVDISPYLFFEATGDSEALSDPITDQNIACQIPIWDDDDAQSCCYDASETHSVDEVINGYKYGDEKKEDEDEVEVCVYGTSNNEAEEEDDDDDDKMQEHQKLGVCVDSGPKIVDEMEKSRLFWEACLAS